MKKIISIITFALILFVSVTACTPVEIEYEKAHVTKVIDGDTIKVDFDGKEYTVRMIGIDTPETVHPKKPVMYFGKEASNFTKDMLKNKTVYLEKDVSDTDKFGRLLRYVWIERPENSDIESIKEKMFNAILISNGYATLFTYPPDVKYNEEFKTTQNEARNNKSGMWKNPSEIGKPDKNNKQKNNKKDIHKYQHKKKNRKNK